MHTNFGVGLKTNFMSSNMTTPEKLFPIDASHWSTIDWKYWLLHCYYNILRVFSPIFCYTHRSAYCSLNRFKLFLPSFDKNYRLLFCSFFYYCLMTSAGGDITADLKDFCGFFIKKLRIFLPSVACYAKRR